ncbi:MAG: hypothetical protein JOY81_14485 [Alphaproteobacteria bacterium]|nr:hypothetical protein [Alphaproteobacteria bacterium]
MKLAGFLGLLAAVAASPAFGQVAVKPIPDPYNPPGGSTARIPTDGTAEKSTNGNSTTTVIQGPNGGTATEQKTETGSGTTNTIDVIKPSGSSTEITTTKENGSTTTITERSGQTTTHTTAPPRHR